VTENILLGSSVAGAHPKWGSPAVAPPPTQNRNYKKNTGFVDTISDILRDPPFSRNQSLKSVDDWYTGILKNKIKNLGSLSERKRRRRMDFVI
jgi:hypothetical protein